MRTRAFAILAVAILIVVALPCAAMADDTAALFNSRCAPCHAKDGSGNTPMGKKIGAKALGSAEVQKLSDAEMSKTILNGKGKMPSFTNKLSPEQVGEVVKLIRSFAAK